MSLQAYSVPEQTDGRRKVSLEWKSIDVSYALSITYGDTVNYYNILTRENREHPGNFQNKSVSSSLI